MRFQKAALMIAIILGVFAAYSVRNYVNNVQVEVSKRATPVRVFVASESLPLGLTIDELRSRQLVKVKSVPEEYVSRDAVKPNNDLGDRVLATSVSEGEQLTYNNFMLSKNAGLSFATPDKKVAVAIPTDEKRAVGNLIKIGDYVNVIGTVEDRDGNQLTQTILQKVQVLAIDKTMDNNDKKEESTGGGLASKAASSSESKKTITLALSQSDAEKIVFVQEKGSIWLTLAPSGQSSTSIPTKGQTLTSIFR